MWCCAVYKTETSRGNCTPRFHCWLHFTSRGNEQTRGGIQGAPDESLHPMRAGTHTVAQHPLEFTLMTSFYVGTTYIKRHKWDWDSATVRYNANLASDWRWKHCRRCKYSLVEWPRNHIQSTTWTACAKESSVLHQCLASCYKWRGTEKNVSSRWTIEEWPDTKPRTGCQ